MAVRIQDAAGTGLTSTTAALDVNIKSSGGLTATVSGTVGVNNFPATQPVSGSVSVSNLPATQAVSAVSLPLPAGAAIAAKQPAIGTAGTASLDVISVQGVAGGVAQPISGSVSISNFPATQPVSGTVTANAGTGNFTVAQATGTNLHTVVDSGTVSVSNFPATQAISATSLPIPAGASTAAKQPALGVAGTPSTDVLTVQGAATGTAMPVSGSVSVSNFPGTQAVSGTVTANAGTGNFTVAQATGTNLHAVVDSGSITATQATAASLNATVVGSGNFTVVQPTGTNLHTVVDSGTVTTVSAVTAITNAVKITGNAGAVFDAASTQNVTAPAAGILTLGEFNTTPTTITTGNASPLQLTAAANLKTDLSSVAGTTTVTSAAGVQKVGIVGNAGATVDTAVLSGAAPTNAVYTVATGTSVATGAYTSKFINASGAAASVKASAGNLYGFSITNETAAVAYIEFFNIATAPTLGTTAVVFAIKLPASANITLPPGEVALQNFTTGIGFAVTTTENGTTAASVTGMIFYQ